MTDHIEHSSRLWSRLLVNRKLVVLAMMVSRASGNGGRPDATGTRKRKRRHLLTTRRLLLLLPLDIVAAAVAGGGGELRGAHCTRRKWVSADYRAWAGGCEHRERRFAYFFFVVILYSFDSYYSTDIRRVECVDFSILKKEDIVEISRLHILV